MGCVSNESNDSDGGRVDKGSKSTSDHLDNFIKKKSIRESEFCLDKLCDIVLIQITKNECDP